MPTYRAPSWRSVTSSTSVHMRFVHYMMYATFSGRPGGLLTMVTSHYEADMLSL